MTYPTQLVELIEEFQDVEDQMERLEMVFEMADEVVVLPVDSWSDTTRIVGCQSEAHVYVVLQEGKVLISGGADSQLVQGLMGILTIAINGSAPAQALLLSPDFAQVSNHVDCVGAADCFNLVLVEDNAVAGVAQLANRDE